MYPTSFFFLLHFVLLSVFVLTSPRKTNYLSIIYGHLQAVLRGCFAKNFYPLTIIGKLRAVCRGISRKFYKKFFLLNQGHANRKVDRIFKILFSTITFSAKITPLYSQGHEFSFCNRFVKFSMNFRKKSVRFRLPK